MLIPLLKAIDSLRTMGPRAEPPKHRRANILHKPLPPGQLPSSLEGRKELSQRTWAQLLLPSGQGATLREASAKMVIQEVLGLLF